MNIYKFPPVGVVGSMWTKSQPVSKSRSFITGAEFVSSSQSPRRYAKLVVSALARDRAGAGYIEILQQLLKGGESLVRLNSRPINWHLDAQRMVASLQSSHLDWETGGNPLGWTTGGNPLVWMSGTVLSGVTGTDAKGYPVITVSGCPPNMVVARPADFLTVFENNADAVGATAQIMTLAKSDAAGVVVIRLMAALPYGGRVNLGSAETAIFRMEEYDPAVQPVGGNWSTPLEFREVLPGEISTPIVEIDPWSE